MLIDAAAALVVRCAKCGKLTLVSESLFNLQRGGKEVNCTCGHPLVKIRVGKKRLLKLEIMCFLCENWHHLSFPTACFRGGNAESFFCPESGLELGLTGPRNLLRERMAAGELERMGLAGDLNLEEYFIDPDIMFQVLNYLYELSHGGKISCQCGHGQLEFNLYAERIELHCNYCGGLLPIPAASLEDLELVQGLVRLKVDSNLYMPTQFGGKVPAKKKRPRNY